MYCLRTEATFDSAHFLSGYNGKCKNLHGHTWRVVVEISAEDLVTEGQTRGMIVDFSKLKATIKNLCDSMDHRLIYEAGTLKPETIDALKNEDFALCEVPFRPTAENFAKYFYTKLKEAGLPAKRVQVFETPTNCAAYEE